MTLWDLSQVLYGACKIRYKGEVLCYEDFVEKYRTPDVAIYDFLPRYEVISIDPVEGIYKYLVRVTDK